MSGSSIRPPGEPRWGLSRLLFLAGVIVAVAAVLSWVLVGAHGGGDDASGGCRVPPHATRGTETAPALVAAITGPLGSPDATFTEKSGGVTVYGYCYDVVGGDALAAVLQLMRQQPYDSAPGTNPSQQLNFTAAGRTPYGVSVSVGGNLDVSNPKGGTDGSMSIVWTDKALPS